MSRKRKALEQRANKHHKKKTQRAFEQGRIPREHYFDVFGTDAKAELELKNDNTTVMSTNRQIKMRDFHSLLLWIVAEAVNPKWIFVRNKPLVEKVVVILVDGLYEKNALEHKDVLPTLYRINLMKDAPLRIHVPNSLFNSACVLQHFLSCHVDKIKGYEKSIAHIGNNVLKQVSSHGGHHHHHHHHTSSNNNNNNQNQNRSDTSSSTSSAGATTTATTSSATSYAHPSITSGDVDSASQLSKKQVRSAMAAWHGKFVDPNKHNTNNNNGKQSQIMSDAQAGSSKSNNESDAPKPAQDAASSSSTTSTTTPTPTTSTTTTTAASVLPGPLHYIATRRELVNNGFPLDDTPEFAHFRSTTLPESSPTSPLPKSSTNSDSDSNSNSVTNSTNSGATALSTSTHTSNTGEEYEESKSIVPATASDNAATITSAASASAPAPAPCAELLADSCVDVSELEHDLAYDDYSLWRAVDCEMVMTASGYNLARVSLLDGDGKVIFDELVKPLEPVTDYLTQYSGMTEELLATAKITFTEAQDLFLKHVTAKHVLVGHSLENDLKALQIRHMRILDTTLLFPHPRGFSFRSSLKYLATKFLNMSIQTGGETGKGGHDSTEDALMSMNLAKLKLSKGPDFGVQSTPSESLLQILGRLQKPAYFIAPVMTVKKYSSTSTHSIPTANDAETVARTVKEVSKPGGEGTLVVAYLPEMTRTLDADESAAGAGAGEDDDDDDALATRKKSAVTTVRPLFDAPAMDFEDDAAPTSAAAFLAAASAVSPAPLPRVADLVLTPPPGKDPRPCLAKIDAAVAKIWEAAPRNTLVAVMSGQASVRAARHVNEVVAKLKNLSAIAAAKKEVDPEVAAKLALGEKMLKDMMNANQGGVLFMNFKT